MPFFAAVTGFYAAAHFLRHSEQRFLSYAHDRFHRLYIPFMVWSGIYLLVRVAARYTFADSNMPLIETNVLWTGPSHHLWYIPFAFVASLTTAIYARLPFRQFTSIAALIFGSVVALTPRPEWMSGYTVSLSYDALPALSWGCAVGIITRGQLPSSHGFGLIGLSVFLTTVLLLSIVGRVRALENVAGIAGLFAGRVSVPRLIALAVPPGRLTYGIYLIHILFVEGVQKVLRKTGIHSSPFTDVFVFVVGASCSWTSTWLLAQSRISWIVGLSSPRRVNSNQS